jgi:hypothetical protein
MAYLSDKDRTFLDKLPQNPKHPPLRKLIDLNCKECVYDTAVSGTWRQQVEECACDQCPLYKVRARSRKGLEVAA